MEVTFSAIIPDSGCRNSAQQIIGALLGRAGQRKQFCQVTANSIFDFALTMDLRIYEGGELLLSVYRLPLSKIGGARAEWEAYYKKSGSQAVMG
jgi:hypothetical protein